MSNSLAGTQNNERIQDRYCKALQKQQYPPSLNPNLKKTELKNQKTEPTIKSAQYDKIIL
jgi:hypothetical protein